MRRRPRGESGSALVEFVYLSVLLMVPLVYLLLAVFHVQAAAFGVTEAARQAARAFVLADSVEAGTARAALAVRLALADQGVQAPVQPTFVCRPAPCDLSPGQQVEAQVSYTVALPFLAGWLGAGRGGVPVTARHVQVVDRFRAPVGTPP